MAIDSNQHVALTALAAAAWRKGNLRRRGRPLLSRLGDVPNLPALEASLALTVRGTCAMRKGLLARSLTLLPARNRDKFWPGATHYDIKWRHHPRIVRGADGTSAPCRTIMGRDAAKAKQRRRNTTARLYGRFPRSGTRSGKYSGQSSRTFVAWMNATVELRQRARFWWMNAGLTRLGAAVADAMERNRILYWKRGREFGCRGVPARSMSTNIPSVDQVCRWWRGFSPDRQNIGRQCGSARRAAQLFSARPSRSTGSMLTV